MYDRKKLEFNLAFIIPHEEYQRLAIYENFIRKIAMHLTVLETFEGYLYDPIRKARIEKICEEIFTNLSHGVSHCYLRFDTYNILCLDYEKKDYFLPPVIKDWHVPVPMANLNLFRASSTDLTVVKVMNSIDGKKFVKQIKFEVQVPDSKIILCLQHLHYQGLIDFIDLFQVTNVYRVTEKVSMILNELSEESVRHLSKSHEATEIDIFNYFCMLSDKSVAEFLEENPMFLQEFDIELFVAFGVLKGIICRIHRYCVANGPIRDEDKQFKANHERAMEMYNAGWLNGNVCMDEICCSINQEQRAIENTLKGFSTFFNK